jgi:hypothetical protein
MGTAQRGRQHWQALLREYEGSDVTMKEFCRRRMVSYWTFREWRRRLSQEPQPGSVKLVEIAAKATHGEAHGKLRLVVGQVVIEVGAPVDEANLAAVLRAVERSRC